MKLNLYIAVFFFNYTTPKDFYYVVYDGIYSMGMLLKNGLSRIFHERNNQSLRSYLALQYIFKYRQ